MFGKKTNELLLNQSGRSFVSETMQVEGDMFCKGAVDIAGLVNGDVHVGEINIMDTGSVIGDLTVRKIEIHGHVEGKIVADTVYLGSNAMIKGDLMFKTSLKTDEGAEINGYISKDKKGEQAKEDI